MTKRDELALITFSVGAALILTGFGLLKVLFDVEINPSVTMARLGFTGLFLAAFGLAVLLEST